MGAVEEVIGALEDGRKVAVCQVAPSVRVSIGEEFGMPPGTVATERLVGALRHAGFGRVFDTSTAADIVTIEEGAELLRRMKDNERLPLLTSCCSASVLYVENNFPELLGHFCTVKSPQQSMGSLVKTYCARKMRVKRRDIYSVSIMPCIVKKLEARRPEMEFNGVKHVDAVLTTKEAAELLKRRGLSLADAPESGFDSLMGKASGSGQLFGTTGGVTEALLRFVSWKLDGGNARIDFPEVRGSGGLRDVRVKAGGREIRIAVVDGLNNLKDILSNADRFGSYDMIEIMTCPGGCIGGSGQPAYTPQGLLARRDALYGIDATAKARTAMDNPAVQAVYRNYLLEPGSGVSQSILHLKRICLKCK
ncbi:MAG: iron hydrogenase small subunit [Candidatus Diapherotrites archaeon]|uniref:Iron hydrogenase small subunit n=1 Tax=Candidatus Iainarchaeum sp. TaxID=3101447 RepID=A0A8T3YP19_9ARCH|nr:iron hydrogenase small subunit [Candidatus Diapherotrites archaeon]